MEIILLILTIIVFMIVSYYIVSFVKRGAHFLIKWIKEKFKKNKKGD